MTGTDPRYTQTTEMFAVLLWDKHDDVKVVAETEQLAQRYIDGQWSAEGYSIRPIQVITALPERRPLYILNGRLPCDPAKAPTLEVDELAAEGEFPGLGNGSIVPLGEVKSSVSQNLPYGWDVHAYGWDLEQVRAAFDARMDVAKAAYTALADAFRPYRVGAVVTTPDGQALLRSTDPRHNVLCWRTPGGAVLYDSEVDPATFTVVTLGERP